MQDPNDCHVSALRNILRCLVGTTTRSHAQITGAGSQHQKLEICVCRRKSRRQFTEVEIFVWSHNNGLWLTFVLVLSETKHRCQQNLHALQST
jgi:hypothetical protein